MTRLVVVGNGMVGSRFVEGLLAADTAGRFTVTVLGAEPSEPYNRVLLSEVLAGTYDLAKLTLPTPVDSRLRVRRGCAAVSIDRRDRVVAAEDGTVHRYDQLVLATGAAARIPPVPGLRAGEGDPPGGVHALRTIDDAREIVAATLNARTAVVLGAGVLGLEAACGLAQRGVRVTVVHPMAALMERQLDETASRVVEAAMSQAGIDHRVGVGAAEVLTGPDGRVRGVRLTDGEVVESRLLLVSTGTVANTALAAAAGLPTQRGVVVTDSLASPADPRVFAIGDCAQPPEGGTGLVAQGWDQARRLVGRLTRATTSAPAPAEPDRGHDVVRLKARGLDVVTMGVCGSQRNPEPGHRALRLSDPAAGRHVEVVVAGGALVGATCVGAGDVAADLVAAYTLRTPLPADPAHLLLRAVAGMTAPAAQNLADLPDTATVCRCNGVSKGEVLDCAAHGATTVEEVAGATRATTGCGGCRDQVCALLDAAASAPPPAPAPAPALASATAPASQSRRAASESGFTAPKHLTNDAEISA